MDDEISETDRAILKRLEEELWIAETRFDQKYMEKVFSADFFEFGRSGRIHSREACLAHTTGTIDAVMPLPNLAIRLLTTDVAQVTYDSEVTYDNIVEKAHRSSIWSRHAEGWQLRFHQGTAFEERSE
ncbi:MAG: DUF4440 domain-containing protein [Granulosicoccus sp.]